MFNSFREQKKISILPRPRNHALIFGLPYTRLHSSVPLKSLQMSSDMLHISSTHLLHVCFPNLQFFLYDTEGLYSFSLSLSRTFSSICILSKLLINIFLQTEALQSSKLISTNMATFRCSSLHILVLLQPITPCEEHVPILDLQFLTSIFNFLSSSSFRMQNRRSQ